MIPAVSTACFYPKTTIDSLNELLNAGVKDVEIFFNTDSELKPNYIKTIQSTIKNAKGNICAVHPFHSAFEWFYFFSGYEGRIEDGIRLYKNLFKATNYLEVPIMSFHGEHKNSSLDKITGYNIYKMLYDIAAEYGITLCQENVSRNRISTPEEMQCIRKTFNDDIAFTVDIKQARRSGYSPLEIIDAAGPCLKHLHLSAQNNESDCVLPQVNDTEIKRIIAKLQEIGYNGNIVIELYRHGFYDINDLVSSYNDLLLILP